MFEILQIGIFYLRVLEAIGRREHANQAWFLKQTSVSSVTSG